MSTKNHLKRICHSIFVAFFLITGCKKDGEQEFDAFWLENSPKLFEMGFSTWAFAPSVESVNSTYQFISENTDIYSEHIDAQIPWNAWINNLPLPDKFTDEISSRVLHRITNKKLTVSVSLLNSLRNDLAADFDGILPNYNALNDKHIEDAYFKHLCFITQKLQPDYLILAIEVNDLLKNAPEKWAGYKLLMYSIRKRIKDEFPTLAISESITLHNFYKPEVPNPDAFITEVADYANSLDFVAVSFYPFFKGLNTNNGFQKAFDFLNSQITKPIAISETGHLSEDLEVDSFHLYLPASQSEQNNYLEVLLTNAQENSYKYIIWWCHRDYNELWETFPDDVKDLGKIWLNTGLLNEDGTEKEAFATWRFVSTNNNQ